MGGESKTTTQTATSEPWAAAQPYLTSNLSTAQSVYSDPYMWTPYQGQTTIDFTTPSQQGLQSAANVAGSYMSVMQNPLNSYNYMMDESKALASGDYTGSIYEQANNLRNSVTNAAFGNFDDDEIFQNNLANTQADTAEQVNLAMSGAGRYGSGQHTDTLATSIMDATNQFKQDYQQQAIDNFRGLTSDLATGQDTAATQLLSYGQAMPDAYAAAIAPADTLRNVGSQYENLQGNYAQEAMDDYYAYADLARQNLGELNALYSGAGGLGSSSSGSSTVTTPTSTSQLLGTGLAGTSYLMGGK